MAKEKAEEVGVALVRFVAQHIATTHCTKATIISYVGQENHVGFFFPLLSSHENILLLLCEPRCHLSVLRGRATRRLDAS